MRLLRVARVRELANQIDENVGKYRSGDFEDLKIDPGYYIDTHHEIDEGVLSTVHCEEDNHREVENCIAVYSAMNGLTPYLARDERIWVYLVHTELLEYSRRRWPIPTDDEKAVAHIRNHFFVSGARGFERDNAASRLWWMALLCSRVKVVSLDTILTCLLYQYDVRANIIERPSSSQNVKLFSQIMLRLNESYAGDRSLFERERFRNAMKELNLQGGTRLLDALDEDDLSGVVEQCFT